MRELFVSFRQQQGHPFTEENTYETPDGERSPRICVRLLQQTPEQKKRKKSKPSADRFDILFVTSSLLAEGSRKVTE